MNSSSLNSASLNTAAIQVVVGVLAIGGLFLTASTEANVRAYGGNVVVLSTEISAYGYQQRNSPVTDCVVSTVGTASAIRQAGFIPKTDLLNTTGNKAERYIYSYGGSSSSVNTSGEITLNYYVEPDPVVDGWLSSTFEVDALRLIVGTTSRVYSSLSGYFVVPRIVTVDDIYFIVALDGFAIPANALGKGEPGTIGVGVVCDAVRTVVAVTSATDVMLGPSVVTNDAIVYRHAGYLPTTGITNVAIQESGTTNWIWYYEDWLTFGELTGTIEPLVFKGGVVSGGSLAVGFEASAIRRAVATLDDGYFQTLVSSIDPDRKAGLIARPVSVRLVGTALTYSINKPADITTVLRTTGTTNGVIRRVGIAVVNVATVGNSLQQNTITPAVVDSAAVATVGTVTGVRRVLGTAIGTTDVSGNVDVLVYKKSYGAAVLVTTGTALGEVMFTTNKTTLPLSGFAYARKIHVGQPIAGVLATTDSGNDYRLAIRMDVQDYWVTTTMDLFTVANLFTRADETRQIVIPANSYAGTDTAHYIRITE